MRRIAAAALLCACMLEAEPVLGDTDGGTEASTGDGGGESQTSTSAPASTETSSTSSGSSNEGSSAESAEGSSSADGTGESSDSGEASTSSDATSSPTTDEGSSSSGGGEPLQGDCVHDLCTVGPALAAGCDGEQACVGTICAADSFCCAQWWDQGCVAKVAMLCGLDC